MDKLKMHTPNKADQNWEKLVELFPNALTETIDENGQVVRAIDKDILMQEINTSVVEGREERYQFTWPDKKKSILLANAPISKTLRPVREESVNFDSTENLYIEGDNLDVLKLLQETYLGKVKMIYIDPPYNTGSNLIYKNDFSNSKSDYLDISGQFTSEKDQLVQNLESNGRFHTDWLNMMYPRLKIAKDLLASDGFIVIAIDDSEIDSLLKICDEIFGENNKLGVVTVVHKPEGRNQEKFFGTSHEYAIFYAKNKNEAEFNNVAIDKEILATFDKKDERGIYRSNNYLRSGGGDHNLRINKPHFWYPIYVSKDLKIVSLDRKEDYYEIFPVTLSGQERTWKTTKSTFNNELISNNIFAERDKSGNVQIFEKYRENQVIKTHWIDKKYHAIHSGTKIVSGLLGGNYFDFPKSIYLIEDVLKLASSKESIILDFFPGSATTAHAVMRLNAEDGGNRKFIMVQLPEETDEKSEAYKAGYKNICEIGKERIRRAGTKIKEENPLTTQDLDAGFRVLKVASSNMKDVYYSPDEYDVNLFDSLTNNIKEDRTGEDLLFQVMLDLGVLLSSKIEERIIADKKVFNVEDGYLIACFDEDVTDETIKAIAQMKPYYFVMRDSSLANDSVATNFEQIFATYSPDTIRKVI